ncbi:hypothetical protein Q7P37_004233 [Cladosporium fusiforme]
MRTSTNTIIATAAFATVALARTDLVGCTSTDVSSPAGASVAWYVPGTGELCDFLDCGGGRAPPKTTVPGCPAYSGTETYSPSYLAGYQAAATSAPSTTSAASTDDESDDTSSDDDSTSTSSFNWSALETNTVESSWDLYTTLASVTGPIPASSTPAESEESSSAAEITESAASSVPAAESSTLVAQTTAAGTASNGTVTGGRPGNNGTVSNTTGGASPSASPSGIVSEGGAAGAAKVWAGAVFGLAALVAAL